MAKTVSRNRLVRKTLTRFNVHENKKLVAFKKSPQRPFVVVFPEDLERFMVNSVNMLEITPGSMGCSSKRVPLSCGDFRYSTGVGPRTLTALDFMKARSTRSIEIPTPVKRGDI